MEKAYSRIDWQNRPNTATPLGRSKLNLMDEALDVIDGRLVAHDEQISNLEDNTVKNNNPEATGAIQLGTGAQASSLFGMNSIAIGTNADANTMNSMAIGHGAKTSVPEQVVLGDYNVTDSTSKLILGGGSDDNNRRTLLKFADLTGDAEFCAEVTDGSGNKLSDKVDTSDVQNLIESILPTDSASGNPCVITDAFGGEAKSLKLTMNPIQDLHGYSKPWAGGGGKNKLPLIVDGIKALNTTGTWNNNTYTINGMTFTVNTDNGGNVTSIRLNGTATAQVILQLGQSPSSGSYTLNGCPAGGNYDSGYSIYITGIYVVDEGAGVDFSLSGTSYTVSILVRSGTVASSVIFYPMIRLSTETDSTFAPYTNICPISGRTEANVVRTGKNLFNPVNVINGYFNPSTPITAMDASRIAFIKCVPNTIYTISKQLGARFVVGYTKEIPNAGVSVYGAVENNTVSSLSITVGSDANYLVAFVYNSNYDTVTAEQMLASVQIEVGSTATTYEPYTGETYTIDLDGTRYGGTVDFKTGELKDAFTIITFDGTEAWSASTIGTNFHQYTIARAFAKNTENAICDKFPRIALAERGVVSGLVGYPNDNTIRIALKDDEYNITNVNDFKTWLGSNNLTIAYEVVNPTTVQLTAEEVTLLHGDNVLTTDTDSIEASYSADIALYIDKKVAEGSQSRSVSSLSLTKSGSSESTEETKETKEEEAEILTK